MSSAASPPLSGLRDPGPLTFQAELLRSEASGAACFVNFPWERKATYGKGNLVPVLAVWDGKVSYRGSLAMMGGDFAMLLCRKDVVAQLGKGPGATVSVTVTLDTAPREVDVPPALADALARSPDAKRAWEALSPSCRREYAQWIAEAKRDGTRTARMEKALPLIQAGRRLK
jgi:hypothetical protein